MLSFSSPLRAQLMIIPSLYCMSYLSVFAVSSSRSRRLSATELFMIWSRATSSAVGCRRGASSQDGVRPSNEQSTGPGSLHGVCHYTAASCHTSGFAIHGEVSVALTQFRGENTRWILLPRIAGRQARTNHVTDLVRGHASGALPKADSAKRESHPVVGNTLGILTLILNKRTIVHGFGISADRAPLALSPQFPHLRSLCPHVQCGGDDVGHLTTVAPVVRAFARIGPNLCHGGVWGGGRKG